MGASHLRTGAATGSNKRRVPSSMRRVRISSTKAKGDLIAAGLP